MRPINKKLKLSLIFLVGLILMLLWIQDFFSSRVGPGVAQLQGTLPPKVRRYEVSWQKVLDWQEAPSSPSCHPVFSGLAWSFIFGIFASTLFTLLVVPIIYYLIYAPKTS